MKSDSNGWTLITSRNPRDLDDFVQAIDELRARRRSSGSSSHHWRLRPEMGGQSAGASMRSVWLTHLPLMAFVVRDR